MKDRSFKELISKTFSANPQANRGMVERTKNLPTGGSKPEASRSVVPIGTTAYVQALVWGNGQVPPIPTPAGPMPSPQPDTAMADEPMPGQPGAAIAPPARAENQGTASALDPVSKGWGQV